MTRTVRGLLVAACALLVVLVGAAGGAPNRFAEDQLLETIRVSAEGSVTSDTKLQPSETYKLVFSGSVHNECKGDPFEEVSDEDAFWLYNFTDRRNPNPASPAGGSFFQYTGKGVASDWPAYSSSHTYTVVLRPPHATGRLVFRDTRSSTRYCTRTGAWTIMIYRVESGTTKTVNEPAPGMSTSIESPPLPAAGVDCGGNPGRALSTLAKAQYCEVDISKSSGDFIGYSQAFEGNIERVAGDFVFWCWLGYSFKDAKGRVLDLSATAQLQLCVALLLAIVSNIGKDDDDSFAPPRPGGRAWPCSAHNTRTSIGWNVHWNSGQRVPRQGDPGRIQQADGQGSRSRSSDEGEAQGVVGSLQL